MREDRTWDYDADYCRVIEGRRTAGMHDAPTGLRYAARAAHHEATSVHAFMRLADELTALGAPATLVACIVRAAADERRHARTLAALAGVPVPTPAKPPVERRTAQAIAIENAVEGCVHEAVAAVLACHQAATASVQVAPMFARIAADECRHADLAWAVAAWLEPRLTRDDRVVVDAARTAALAQLPSVAAAHATRATAEKGTGMPTPSVARELASDMAGGLAA